MDCCGERDCKGEACCYEGGDAAAWNTDAIGHFLRIEKARQWQAAQVAAPAAPQAPVQRTMVGMLEASVAAYGQVVSALLFDLQHISEDMDRFSWLSRTMNLLSDEQVYRTAVAQLQWWDTFLQNLPRPQLLSDHQEQELRNARAEQQRTILLARSRALADHRRLLEAELSQADLGSATRTQLMRWHEDPQGSQWRVDPEAYVQQALSRLPPLPEIIPIIAQDLDPQHSFSGFNAANAMREHPELGPRAVQMDAALAVILRQEFNLSRAQANQHARILTDMFWLALRRALSEGGHKLAASIQLFVTAHQAGIQEQFASEVLKSWLHHLEHLPPKQPRPRIGQRIPLLRRLTEHTAAPEIVQPRQIAASDAPPRAGLWRRLKGALKQRQE